MLSLPICRWLNIGQASFRCQRKDKFGFSMQAICDHKLRFYWAEVKWPGSASDFMAFVTSLLCMFLERNDVTKLLRDDMTLVGNNAYVKQIYMAVPLRGNQSGWGEGYNFSLSQIRITIERAFGVFVHRWAILRAPLTIPILKVPALVPCLIRLHNFCIDAKEMDIASTHDDDFSYLFDTVAFSNRQSNRRDSAVPLDSLDRPSDLLNCGRHFVDAEQFRTDRSLSNDTPMDRMLTRCEEMDIRRSIY